MLLNKRFPSTVVLVIGAVLASADALQAADPVISELMASNATTLADEDGDYSDWIEIHNPGPASVDLTGWYLTDDATELTKWQFPSATLADGDYLIVFASDKDRGVAGSELHTNFKLGGDGEYLALVESDGVTVVDEYTPVYPEQRTDISYGLSGVMYGYFAEPTPGAANDTTLYT